MTQFKAGDIVRYSSGSSALIRLETPHARGWYGVHCLGGYHFTSNPQEASPEDVATFNELRVRTLSQQGRSEKP